MKRPEDNFLGRWSRRKRDAGSERSGVIDRDRHSELPADMPAEITEPAESEPSLSVESDPVANGSVANGSVAEGSVTESPVAERKGLIDAGNSNGHLAGEADQNSIDDGLTDADMVPLDTLDASSDYTPFMSEGVSSELKKAALKKLFFSGRFAARDGLDDYDDDFTYFEPLGDTVTSDMKYHARRKERDRLAKLEKEAELELEANKVEANDETAQPVAETPDDTTDSPPDEAPDESSSNSVEPESADDKVTDPKSTEQPAHSRKPHTQPAAAQDDSSPNDSDIRLSSASDQSSSSGNTA